MNKNYIDELLNNIIRSCNTGIGAYPERSIDLFQHIKDEAERAKLELNSSTLLQDDHYPDLDGQSDVSGYLSDSNLSSYIHGDKQ